jgi:hypothetical protein
VTVRSFFGGQGSAAGEMGARLEEVRLDRVRDAAGPGREVNNEARYPSWTMNSGSVSSSLGAVN